MNRILHVTTHILSPDLIQRGRYVPAEYVFCFKKDLPLHTERDCEGWTAISCLPDTMEKLDYADYVLCPKCVEHPEVALFLLGDLP